jgi:hypothetical protein
MKPPQAAPENGAVGLVGERVDQGRCARGRGSRGWGVMPRYTPVGGSWSNMAESLPRVLKRRARDGQHPTSPDEMLTRFDAVVRHWNKDPTPFVWGGRGPPGGSGHGSGDTPWVGREPTPGSRSGDGVMATGEASDPLAQGGVGGPASMHTPTIRPSPPLRALP